MSKTRITHTLFTHEGTVGFNFLGFNVRQFAKSRRRTSTSYPIARLTTIIRPAKENSKRHYRRLCQLIDHQSDQTTLIEKLNPIIRGWCNYYSRVVSKECFSRLDHLLLAKLNSWAKRRHPTKSSRWLYDKYWQMEKGKKWRFRIRSDKAIGYLTHHSATPIVRHIKVQQNRSPYDGDWVYWSTRMGRFPQVNNRIAALLKKQQGKCTYCQLFFTDKDRIEVDHIIPRSKGGQDLLTNLQALHRHCHDTKTIGDLSKEAKN